MITTNVSDPILNIFALLSDGTRLAILDNLDEGEMNVGDICEAMGMTQPAVSHHLALLRVSEVVVVNRRGKFNFYTLSKFGRAILRATKSMRKAVSK